MFLLLSHSSASLRSQCGQCHLMTDSPSSENSQNVHTIPSFIPLQMTLHFSQKILIHSSQIPRRLKTHYHQSGKKTPFNLNVFFFFFLMIWRKIACSISADVYLTVEQMCLYLQIALVLEQIRKLWINCHECVTAQDLIVLTRFAAAQHLMLFYFFFQLFFFFRIHLVL